MSASFDQLSDRVPNPAVERQRNSPPAYRSVPFARLAKIGAMNSGSVVPLLLHYLGPRTQDPGDEPTVNRRHG